MKQPQSNVPPMMPRFLFGLCLAVTLLDSAAGADDRALVRDKTETDQRGSRVALVIGNSAYRTGRLKNPANDAADMADKLRGVGFDVTHRPNLNREGLYRALRDFDRRLKPDGVGLFYYAGHGMQVDNRNYLIPVDSGIEAEVEVPFRAIALGEVLAKLDKAPTRLNIVFLDACRNNPFARSFRSSHLGLAKEDTPRGTLIVYATAPNRVAKDGAGRNGVFTRHLLAQLGTKGQEVGQLVRRVREQVMLATQDRQVPWSASSLVGNFYFEPAAPSPPRPGDLGGDLGPDMVRIAPGCFDMGSPPSEVDRDDDERLHRVCIDQAFGIGRYEATFEEYDRFAQTTGRDLPDDEGWGRGRRPVINVSWEDATAYAEWLSRQTRRRYRLPTEAEWEYAARAGTQTPFSTGPCIHTDQANYVGKYDYANCGARTGVYRGETLPVGSLQANPWGLYDVHGNVWEWTCSTYDATYAGEEQRCATERGGRRALRGGSWDNFPRYVRAAGRYGYAPVNRYSLIGFRRAQDL